MFYNDVGRSFWENVKNLKKFLGGKHNFSLDLMKFEFLMKSSRNDKSSLGFNAFKIEKKLGESFGLGCKKKFSIVSDRM